MRERGAFSRHKLENYKNIKWGRISLFLQNFVKLEIRSQSQKFDAVIQISNRKATVFTEILSKPISVSGWKDERNFNWKCMSWHTEPSDVWRGTGHFGSWWHWWNYLLCEIQPCVWMSASSKQTVIKVPLFRFPLSKRLKTLLKKQWVFQ